MTKLSPDVSGITFCPQKSSASEVDGRDEARYIEDDAAMLPKLYIGIPRRNKAINGGHRPSLSLLGMQNDLRGCSSSCAATC
jgi:hypothetical protein